MAKDKLTEYDSNAANNTVVGDVNLAENSCLPSDLNNAVRELMSHQKEAFGSGTPLYVDQTNNRVGIGASPDKSLDVNIASATMRIRDASGGNDFAVKTIAGPVSLAGSTVNTAIGFMTNDTERLRILAGGGLTFNGDTAAANALDDYEIGTWTPADGSGAGLTLTQEATQSYVKIGNLVYVNMYVSYPITSNSSTAILTGFPYTAFAFNYLSGRVFNSGTNDMVWQLNNSSATLYFNNGLRTNANLSGAYVLLSGSYYTTA